MRLHEVVPAKPMEPLTPKQMQAANDKRAEANARVQDARKEAQIKVAAARRKAAQL